MERNFTSSEQKRQNPTVAVEKWTDNAHSVQAQPDFKLPFLEQHFHWLHRLKSDLSLPERPRALVQTPVSMSQLEMLEAELNNQGLLSKSRGFSAFLHQRALHETGIWRWRAKRFNLPLDLDSFAIDLPRYIAERAAAITAETDDRRDGGGKTGFLGSPGAAALIAELRYLDSFAAYVYGAFDKPKNRYQRGLNLVLRVLSSRHEQSERQEKRLLILPLTRRTFFNCLREIRSAQPKPPSL